MWKSLIGLAALIAADDHKPAWERAAAYVCRADAIRICGGKTGQCQVEPGQAVMEVDFAKSRLHVFGSGHQFDETIVHRKFLRMAGGDLSVVHFDGGGRVMNFGPPVDGIVGVTTAGIVPAQFVSADMQQVITHFMHCEPR